MTYVLDSREQDDPFNTHIVPISQLLMAQMKKPYPVHHFALPLGDLAVLLSRAQKNIQGVHATIKVLEFLQALDHPGPWEKMAAHGRRPYQ